MLKSKSEIKSAPTGELVETYNSLTGKSIKKFSSRDAGEKQTAAAFDAKAKTGDSKGSGETEKPASKPTKGQKPDVSPAGKPKSAAKAVPVAAKPVPSLAEQALKPVKPVTAKTGAERGASVKASWDDKSVREARATKNHVKVDGVEYRSVYQAFEKLNLPLGKVIKFRGELKAAGTLKFGDYTFAIVE